jgi:hypothetical protein
MSRRRHRHRIHAEKIYVIRVNVWHRWYRRIALFLIVLALPIGAYYGTEWYLGQDQRELDDQNQALRLRMAEVRAEVLELEQQNANLLMAAEMDEQAGQQLRNELVEWRERNETLQSEIQFYLSLMEPSSNERGVFIANAELIPTEEPSVYRYSVIIGQKSLNHPRVTGAMRLQVISENENQYTVMGLADMTDGGAELPLGFRFFQQMEGTLYLPAGFSPNQWMVEVDLASSSSDSIRQTYDWPYFGR